MTAVVIQAGSYWAGEWAERKTSYEMTTDNDYGHVFLAIIGIIFFCIIIKGVLLGQFASRTAYGMFNTILFNLIKRPQSYFDTTPMGVILNRCNEDVFQNDYIIQSTLYTLLDLLSILLIAVVLLALALPYILILIAQFVVMFTFHTIKYLKTSVELRRLTQLALSPLLGNIGEGILGVTTFKAFGKVEWIRPKFGRNVDLYLNSQIHERLSAVWFNYRLELMVSLLAGVAPFMIALAKTQSWRMTSANGYIAIFGTILTNILLLGNMVGFFVFAFTEVAKGMSSVERLFEYMNYNVHERSWDSPKAPENWPSEGKIEIKNLVVSYRPGLPQVLKGVDLSIEKNQKVGIVGRTGSGKSTILLSIMRILEVDEDENKESLGHIEIDGVKIDSIGIQKLRKNITIIPQDPFLIQRSLRFNIDPASQYSDDIVIETLNKVHVLESIRKEDIIDQKVNDYKTKNDILLSKKEKSNKEVSDQSDQPDDDPEIRKIRESILSDNDRIYFRAEGAGSNLSLGQRQLICIARALIKKPKILLMDEATANIDQRTDGIIQRLVKHDTCESTVAHRLATVVQYDTLLVLDRGVVADEGRPADLLRAGGYFAQMVSEGGPEFEQKMMKLAGDRELDPNSV